VSALHDLYLALHGDDRAAALSAARALHGKRVVVVSACLLGERTRYDGGDKLDPRVIDRVLHDPTLAVLPLCPEILGGMGCPRPPVHFAADGRAVDDRGRDRTAELTAGAARADELAAAAGASEAILKERSPSCGVRTIHGPAGVQAGRGRFADRLAARHLPVLSEDDVV
jgi:uncharacterized protein YbbK (DUF523 family)